ncbi:2-phospho-L-lactate guanylyltransferase [Pseudonocardia sp. CNS-139]|nr:2-phospho-L-lactate guanylyltransferase [Pseudonocardia sp. CNS-139]
MGSMMPTVDLVVPVKPLAKAKSRLRGAADNGIGAQRAHARLAMALARDTLAAVQAAASVRHLLVVSSDPVVAAELGVFGIEVVPDVPAPRLTGLNAAYARGAALLRERDPAAVVGALQADLPALRPADLDAAVGAALDLFAAGVARVFVPDAGGTGTTFLLAAAGVLLDPRFGAGSATAHAASGAALLSGEWPGLRRDVDTADDLRDAAALGLGEHTAHVMRRRWIPARDPGGRAAAERVTARHCSLGSRASPGATEGGVRNNPSRG